MDEASLFWGMYVYYYDFKIRAVIFNTFPKRVRLQIIRQWMEIQPGIHNSTQPPVPTTKSTLVDYTTTSYPDFYSVGTMKGSSR